MGPTNAQSLTSYYWTHGMSPGVPPVPPPPLRSPGPELTIVPLPFSPSPPPPAVQSEDRRVLQAAAEVTQRGLAYITLLGDPETVRAEAEKMGIDLSLVDVVSPVVRGQDRV